MFVLGGVCSDLIPIKESIQVTNIVHDEMDLSWFWKKKEKKKREKRILEEEV